MVGTTIRIASHIFKTLDLIILQVIAKSDTHSSEVLVNTGAPNLNRLPIQQEAQILVKGHFPDTEGDSIGFFINGYQ